MIRIAVFSILILCSISLNAQDRFNKQLLVALNAERAKVGAPPVVYSEELSDAAYLQADILHNSRYLAHSEPISEFPDAPDMNGDGICDYYDRAEFCGWVWGPVSENGGVTKGNIDGQSCVNMWLGSPGHRINMLNPAWTHVGGGKGPWGAGRNSFWAVFGEDLRVTGD